MRAIVVFLCVGNVFCVGLSVGSGHIGGWTLIYAAAATVCGIAAMSEELL